MTTNEWDSFRVSPLISRKHEHVRGALNRFAVGPTSFNNGRLKQDARLVRLLTSDEPKASMFLNDIWGVKHDKKDAVDLAKFAAVIREVCLGKNTSEISTELSVPYNTVRRWRSGRGPNITNTLKSVTDFGQPKVGQKWLPLNLGTHGELKSPIIQVVEGVRNIREVRDILAQLEPLETTYKRALQFGLDEDDVTSMKVRLFFYLLGVMVGDASKRRRSHRKTSTMEIDLALSKKHDSNVRFGEFVAMCVNSLGLRMNRVKDRPSTEQVPNGAYRWGSQSSLLVRWIFEACLGLREGQTTTYDPIKAGWIFAAQDDEKVSFIQGLADSDGFNDIQSVEVHIISLSNASFIQAILKSLGITCRREYSARFGTENVIMRMEEAHRLPVYNPWVMSYRFMELNKLMKAKRYARAAEWPDWLRDEITRLVKAKRKAREIFDTLLSRYGVLIPCDTIRYFAKTQKELLGEEEGEDALRRM